MGRHFLPWMPARALVAGARDLSQDGVVIDAGGSRFALIWRPDLVIFWRGETVDALDRKTSRIAWLVALVIHRFTPAKHSSGGKEAVLIFATQRYWLRSSAKSATLAFPLRSSCV
jgi:hypothetical protein